MAIFHQLIEDYLVCFGSLNPVTNSQITKAHQITRTTSRNMAFPVAGFTNRPLLGLCELIVVNVNV